MTRDPTKMSCYQKFYTNQIHSSSLLCQLATMWKSQVLCDAVIRSGSVITKAHRVVLVAACPMLQSMENASMGSHLEVRLASDIKQDSIITFLQYLYEGFMMLTEENCRDVEKIARLLQVDSVIKCVSDFYKCLSAKTGSAIDDRFKYTSYDLLEFKHVRSSDIQKTLPETALKRGPDYSTRPSSPGNKRQRMHHTPSPSMDTSSRVGPRADDTLSMANSYGGGQGRDPWDQRGRGGARVPQPGVIDIVEDSIELIQTEDSDKSDSHIKQKSVSIAVTSQYNTATDVRVVNVTDPGGTNTPPTSTSQSLNGRGSITVSPLPIFTDSSSSQASAGRPPDSQPEITSIRQPPPSQPVFPTLTPMQRPPPPVTQPSKPFAAGSVSQISSSQNRKSDTAPSPGRREGNKGDGGTGGTHSMSEDDTPDLSIVKIESNNDQVLEGLDMYVDRGDDGVMRLQGMDDSQNDEGSDTEQDQTLEWGKEDVSNEGSNLGTDQNNSWYIDQFKGDNSLQQGTSDMKFNTVGSRSHSTSSSRSRSTNSSVSSNTRSSVSGNTRSSVSDNTVGILANSSVASVKENSNRSDGTMSSAEFHFQLQKVLEKNKLIGKPLPEINDHRMIKITEGTRQRPCVVCRIYNRRTNCGDPVRTIYMCKKCELPLCFVRNCFTECHEQLKEHFENT